MVLTLFVGLFLILILAELVKGLSANGTPPVLQKLPGQLHLAYFMWSSIQVLRGAFCCRVDRLRCVGPAGGSIHYDGRSDTAGPDLGRGLLVLRQGLDRPREVSPDHQHSVRRTGREYRSLPTST